MRTLTLSEAAEAVRKILAELYRLAEIGAPSTGINKIERETIFFLYECWERKKWSPDRPHSRAARLLTRTKHQKSNLSYDHAIPLHTLRAGQRYAFYRVNGVTSQ